MTLDPNYLSYPERGEGYDHDLYEWSALHKRPPVRWPQGSVAVWICISLEWFPMLKSDEPFRAPGHMVTPYPDFRHYTSRDYGNRVGVWRFLDALGNAGVKACFATNAAVAERYPELVAAIRGEGHEVIAHSTDMNGTIAGSMEEDAERALIADAVARLSAATGEKPKGWLSIARSQSFRTADLLKEQGIAYQCDWVNDELPYRWNNGIVNLPLNHELSDRTIIAVQQQSADSWAQSMEDAFDWLAKEARGGGGRMLPIHVTPYIMGLPYRIAAFERMLERLSARPEAWFARGDEIVESWAAQG